MENNKQFKITYYANKDKKHITRQGKWDRQMSDIGQVKLEIRLITYYDMDKHKV